MRPERGQPFFCASALAALLLGAAVGGCASAPPAGGASPAEAVARVRVRLMYQESAVPAATITAVKNPGVGNEEERVSVSAGGDGWGVLPLAPGTWYIVARSDEREIFGWFGSNPLQVRPGEAVEIAVRGVAAGPPPRSSPAAPGEEEVAGEVTGEDGPLARASVAFYLDASSQFRGPGYLEAQTDDEGRFAVRISPGRYYLVVRRRSGPAAFGPLEAGDAFGFYAGNPLYLRSGERLALRLAAVRVMKKSGWSAPSALRTRVSGTVRDAAGWPLAGYRAFLHAKPSMLGKPEFVSEPSDAGGVYTIWVDREGRYYLGARAEIGRAREEKEVVGLYGGSPDHGIVVRLGEGELRQMDITVDAGEGGR